MNSPETFYYRTKDGEDYVFDILTLSDGSVRAYIQRQPSYCNRNESAHRTHRVQDMNGMYISWDRTVRSCADMKRIASLWADETQKYIKTGKAIGA